MTLAATLVPFAAFAGGATNIDARGLATHGHDPVAYFVEGRPVVGKPELGLVASGVVEA